MLWGLGFSEVLGFRALRGGGYRVYVGFRMLWGLGFSEVLGFRALGGV